MTDAIDPHLRAMLVCPVCRGALTDTPTALICPKDDLSFPVVDGVPHLVRELARSTAAAAKR